MNTMLWSGNSFVEEVMPDSHYQWLIPENRGVPMQFEPTGLRLDCLLQKNGDGRQGLTSELKLEDCLPAWYRTLTNVRAVYRRACRLGEVPFRNAYLLPPGSCNCPSHISARSLTIAQARVASRRMLRGRFVALEENMWNKLREVIARFLWHEKFTQPWVSKDILAKVEKYRHRVGF